MNTQPEEVTISCPHCGQHLAIDESMLGTELECPACKQSITAPRSEEQASGEAIVAEKVAKEVATGKARKRLHKAKGVLASACRRAKELFFRLPERAQGALMASAAFLIGIALFSGKGEPTHPEKASSNGDSARATQKPLPRPDIKPLKDDKESARWLCASSEGDWKEVMRFPEKYKGKAFYIEGMVTRILNPDPDANNHLGNVWVKQDGKSGENWVVVFDDERTKLPEGNILNDDHICVFGTFEKIHNWKGTNAFNVAISGKNPVLWARLISTDNHDNVMRSYGKEDDKKAEKTSSHPTSYSAPPNSTQRENTSQDVPRKPIGEERAQEEANSLYQEAMRYYNGDGVLQNYDKAVQLLFDASSKGSKDADAELAGIFWNGKANQQSNEELAVKYALKHGDQRKADASMVLGLSYLFGYKTKDGKVAPDFPKAYEQFTAAGHHQQAVFFKGLMEYHGVGTAKSAQKAAETFYECCKGKTKALSVGDAAVCLGYLYYKGEGVAKNYDQAKAWLSWGWKHGHAPKVAVINELGQYPGGMDLLLKASTEYYTPLGGYVFQW